MFGQALYAYQHRELKQQEIATICQWIERCSCWEHSDDLSKIYATVVEENPNWMVPEIHSAYPQETADYINRKVLAIATLAWSAATEKLDKADKARLNAARRTARSMNR